MDMKVSLTKALADFVQAKVATGGYRTSSEVVSEALQLMETRERVDAERLRFLQADWREGVESGDAGEVDFAALKLEARARFAASKA